LLAHESTGSSRRRCRRFHDVRLHAGLQGAISLPAANWARAAKDNERQAFLAKDALLNGAGTAYFKDSTARPRTR